MLLIASTTFALCACSTTAIWTPQTEDSSEIDTDIAERNPSAPDLVYLALDGLGDFIEVDDDATVVASYAVIGYVGTVKEVVDPSPNEEYKVGGAVLTILSPTKDYGDKNENSIVARLDFGETSVMLTGDAEKKVEKDILATYSTSDLDCDVLKVGHHGSSTSSTQEFIDAVTPQYAIISVGEGNKYNHPNADTVKRLEDAGATVLRTDQLGNIVLESDGKVFTKK